ncbi:hypothetical protein CAEBREN_12436 [Caenorhabditis brenneri]|uniref:Uncharacterized protein n=1 Tax=Caenorhabditis brenneri TaxID=135651 RepID=G0NN66_CAEBE|nr:hypothetical protein CAEBREN_12436 [Caenorhabditis brenneri]
MAKPSPPESIKKYKNKEGKRKEETSQKSEHDTKEKISSDVAGSSKNPPRAVPSRSHSGKPVGAQKEKSQERVSGKASGLSVKDASNEREGRSPVKKDPKKKKNRSLTTGSSQEKKKRSAERDSTDGNTKGPSLKGPAKKEKRSSSERDPSEGRNEQSIEKNRVKTKKKRCRTGEPSGTGTAEKEEENPSTELAAPKSKRPVAASSSAETSPEKDPSTWSMGQTPSSSSSREFSLVDCPTEEEKTPLPTADSPCGNNELLPVEYSWNSKKKTKADVSSEKLLSTKDQSISGETLPAKDTSKKQKIRLSSKSPSQDSDNQLTVRDPSKGKKKRSRSEDHSTSNKGSSTKFAAPKSKRKPAGDSISEQTLPTKAPSADSMDQTPSSTSSKKLSMIDCTIGGKTPRPMNDSVRDPSEGKKERSRSQGHSTSKKDKSDLKDAKKGKKKKSIKKKSRSKSEGNSKVGIWKVILIFSSFSE